MRREWLVYAMAGAALLAFMMIFSFYSDPGTPSRSDLDAEAEKKAQEYIERTVAKCGDGYYVKAERTDVDLGKLTQRESLLHFHIQPVAVVVKSQYPLTEADRLNGIEWKGAIRVVAVAYREHYLWGTGGWSSWADQAPYNYSSNPLLAGPLLDSNLTRQNGQWSIGSLDIGKPRVSKPDCSEIPAG